MDSSWWPQGTGAGVVFDQTTAAASEKKPNPPNASPLKCPRCTSPNTKFCYYNNYSLSQPRYFCKNCRRYWTEGGSLRNVPVGGSSRKNKRSSSSSSSSSSSPSASKKPAPDLNPQTLVLKNPKPQNQNVGYNPFHFNNPLPVAATPWELFKSGTFSSTGCDASSHPKGFSTTQNMFDARSGFPFGGNEEEANGRWNLDGSIKFLV